MAIKLLSDLVTVVSEHISNPSTSGFEIFVGLEHYDAGEPVITRFGSTANLESSVKHFIEGDILVARRNVYLKRAGVVKFEGVTSGDSIVLRVKDECYKDIIPFILNTEEFWDYAEQNSDGTMSKRLAPDVLLEYECDIPDNHKDIAKKLWAAYELKEAYKKMIAATDEMVKSQFIEMFGNPLSQEQKYPMRKLSDCCIINPRRTSINLTDSDYVSFVPMPSVSENGSLQDVMDEEYGKVKKGFTYFENNDVLFAKITPCMENGKGAIAHGLTNGIGMGSTEFHILRPIKELSNPYWLLCLTRMPIFRKLAEKNMSGTGGQKRVSAAFLDNFMIGLPPIEAQKTFEEVYKQADKSKFVGFKSQFIEMFGDVIKNSNDWREYGPIGNYADIVLGSTPDSKNPKYWDGDICWVTPAELNDDVVVINDTVRHITNDGVSAANLTKLPKGSVLFSTRAPIGKVAITGVEMYCNQGFKNFICGDKLNNLYLYYTLKLNRDYLCALGTGTTFKELSKKVVESISIAIPPIEMQNKFEDVFKQADKSKYIN